MLRPYSCYMKNVTEERRAVMVRKRDWGFVLALSIMSSTGVIAAGSVAGAVEVISRGGIVAAESPLAAQAGLRVLESGGNAVDAAIATKRDDGCGLSR